MGIDLVSIFDGSLIATYVVHQGRVAYANKAMVVLLGYEHLDEVLGREAIEFTAPEDRSLFSEMHRRRLAGELHTASYCYRALKKDGSRMSLMVTGGVVPYRDDLAVVGMAFDGERQFDAERQFRLSNQVLNSVAEGIIITDPSFRIEVVNPAFSHITGYTADESIGKLSGLFNGRYRDQAAATEVLASLERTGNWQGELVDRRKSGEIYPAWLSISTVLDEKGLITNYVYVFTDNTRRKEVELRLRDLAARDGLTGLLNRSAFTEALGQRVEAALTSERKLAVFFIDLDHFKWVNDTMGHHEGDQLIREMAARMNQILREGDLAARFGGDEFVVAFEGLHTPAAANTIAERLIESISRPVRLGAQEVSVTASIGWAICPDDADDADQLLRKADMAMYEAKATGRNGYQGINDELLVQNQTRAAVDSDLRRAMERGELYLNYQPQVDCDSGRLLGAEALLRWRNARGQEIPPSQFIPLAEGNGQIFPIGDWLLRQACGQLRQWRDQGLDVPRMSINISPLQLQRDRLVSGVIEALQRFRLAPGDLEIEITEGAVMHLTRQVRDVLARLRELGITLAMDDFGTGYSSLSVLKHIPLSRLKIDRSFVSGLPDDADDAAITEAIIVIAQKMRLEVVAEGVETQSQWDCLRRLGCQAIQGFLVGRPMSPEAFARFAIDLVRQPAGRSRVPAAPVPGAAAPPA